jgi:hypothetical protein
MNPRDPNTYSFLKEKVKSDIDIISARCIDKVIEKIEEGVRQADRNGHDIDKIEGVEQVVTYYASGFRYVIKKPQLANDPGKRSWFIDEYSHMVNAGIDTRTERLGFDSQVLSSGETVLAVLSQHSVTDLYFDHYKAAVEKNLRAVPEDLDVQFVDINPSQGISHKAIIIRLLEKKKKK